MATPKKGQYINLDFAYLQELSILDMYLRKTIIIMTLDVEHALKTQLFYDLSMNDKEDGYSIVEEFLSDYRYVKSLHDKIGRSATSDLIQKHRDNHDQYALWEIVEVLSLGDFIYLYQLYYSKYPSKSNFCSYLWSIKFLRNAAAHNNCLLNSLKAPFNVTIHKTKEIQFEISKIKHISQNSREKWMANPIIHDFIILVFTYLKLVKSPKLKQTGIDQLHWLLNERMLKHKEYFEKNTSFFRGDDACIVSVFFISKYLRNF